MPDRIIEYLYPISVKTISFVTIDRVGEFAAPCRPRVYERAHRMFLARVSFCSKRLHFSSGLRVAARIGKASPGEPTLRWYDMREIKE